MSGQNFNAVNILEKKREGEILSDEEINWFIKGVTDGSIPDYQTSAFLMASYIQGLDKNETAALTNAMLNSGDVLDFKDPLVIDKHSTGGIGDKTSFILAPIAAACGVRVPMIAGRGLGHTGGTVDKIEAIPGYETEIGLDQFQKLVKEYGVALIGQTKTIAPADKKIYSLRDVTGTVPSISLITASIMSKKLASGLSGIAFDIKVGNGAFLPNKSAAKKLVRSMGQIAKNFNKKATFFLTDMSQPLGTAVGNSLEIIECIDVLKNQGPKDITKISLELAAEMVYLSGVAKSQTKAMSMAKSVLQNGKAFKVFEEMIKRQGGDTNYLHDTKLFKIAKNTIDIPAPQKGWVKSFNTKAIGMQCVELGGGRKVASDKIDFGVGLMIHKKIGDKVAEGEPLATIYYNDDQSELARGLVLEYQNEIIKISKNKVAKVPLILEVIR